MEGNRQGIEEKGRSLMEMLGSLAIMGILSIGALFAYNYAMNGVRANTILYGVNKRAHTCITQTNLMGRSGCNLSEYGETIEGKYPTQVMRMDNGFFGIQVGEISAPVCRQIQSKGLKIASQILPEACDETTVTFIFNHNLDGSTDGLPVSCANGESCGDCEQCGESGFCESTCSGGAKCAADFEHPDATKSCCPASKLVGNVCCANPDGNGNCCDSSGKNCCPPARPFMTADGVCHSCDDYSNSLMRDGTKNTSANCTRCPNRQLRRGFNLANKYCVLKNCPSEKPLQSHSGQCYSCAASSGDITIADLADGYNDSCSLCPDRGEVGYYLGTQSTQCIVCPGESYKGENGRCVCPPGKPILGKDGCHACGENVRIEGFQYEGYGNSPWCTICPNKKKYGYCCGITYCGAKNKESGKIRDWSGVLYACDTSDNIQMTAYVNSTTIPTSPDSCSDCSGRYTAQSGKNSFCKKCPAQGTTAWNNLSDSQRVECGG